MAAFAAIALAYATGEAGPVEDTTLAFVLVVILFTGFLGSLAAFVMAGVAAVKGVRWMFLWLPRCVFPALVLFVVLGEALWWE